MASCLPRDTFGSYSSIQQKVNQSSVTMSNQLKEMIDCETKALQQGVHDALQEAARGVQRPFVDSEVVGRNLNLIVAILKRYELANPWYLSAHSASCVQRQCRTRVASYSRAALIGDTFCSSAPAFRGATDS